MHQRTWIVPALVALFLAVVVVMLPRVERFEGTDEQRCRYLEDMVKYLKIVVRMQQARRDLFYPTGFGSPPQTFSSPELTALEKQRQFFIERVKKDPQQLAFFRENLTLPI